LVDEATVAIENIHAHLQRGQPLAQAVLDGSTETSVPRALAMRCVVAGFVSWFFMPGAARWLVVRLSLSVGFAMVASYILSSTFVPVLCIWLLKSKHSEDAAHPPTFFDRLRDRYERLLSRFVQYRWALVGTYLVGSLALIVLAGMVL